MIRRALLVAALTASVAVFGACSTPPEPESTRIDTAAQLVDALRDAGAEVEETAILPLRPALSGGQVVFVGAERVEIYQFETRVARQVATTRWMDDETQALDSTDGDLVVWATGRILVVYGGFDGGRIALLSGLLGDPVTLPQGVPVEPYPPAVAAAVGWLAESLEVDPGEVVVRGYASAQWPDSCLGLPRADELCAQVMTPGWRIVLVTASNEHTLRADQLGSVIREEP